LHQFTLLVRRIRGNEKWFKALQSAGIPLAIGSGGLFWDDPRVRELVSFLKWWNCEANTLSGAIFLRAPWMGIADEELDRWVREDPTWKTPFFQSSHRIAKKLAPLRDRIVRPGELLLALLSDLGESESESELGAPLLGLWHRVEELSSRGMDFSAVVTEIAAAMKENRREREVPAPRNLGQLSVLTLHGAKGLEFDQVILIDFGISRRRSDAPLLFWDRTLGVYLGKRDESGNRQPKNPQEQSWRDLEKKKNLAESKRLFYVALTRAKERLILVCTGESSQESTDSSVESIYSCDDWRGWIDRFAIPIFEINSKNGFKSLPKAHHSQRYPIFQGGSNLANPSWFEQKRPRHSVTEWNLLSRCPRAYEWTYIHSKKKQNPLDQSPSKSGSPLKGVQAEDSLVRQAFQELGTQVHACLASGDDEGLKALESNSSLKDLQGLRFSSAPVIEWRRKSSWMAPANRVMGRDVWVELPFEVPVYGETLVGSIDRLILEKRGSTSSYSLLDFKVTQSFKRKDILLEAYGTQLLLYTMALTILDPKIRWTDIDAALVNVTPAGVQVLAVPVQRDSHRVHELADLAGRIVNGHSGEPKCGPLCQFCEFLDSCQEGKLYLGKTSVVTDSSESDTYELESGQTDLNFSQRSPNVSWFT
jgi:ATP-dependent exoDNAse (exonuclease V) beta subunit